MTSRSRRGSGSAVASVSNLPTAYAGVGKLGLLEGNTTIMVNQVAATLLTWIIAAVGSRIILKIIDAIMGLRVSESHEYQGLDLSRHGESGYNMEDARVFGAKLLEAPAGASVDSTPKELTQA